LAFFFRSLRGERIAGPAVVLAIFISALVALGQTIERFIHPRTLSHLWLLAAARVIGFVGNEDAAQVRLRARRRLQSAALVADGNHARVDGFVSLGVLASAIVVGLGLNIADPVIGLVITLVILRITWELGDSCALSPVETPASIVVALLGIDHHDRHADSWRMVGIAEGHSH
jgi:divalent metal cation (Fe/Co/Zn/Cd) transporter